MAGCGADTQANILIGTLTTDAVFPIPNPDLSDIVFPAGALEHPVVPLTIADLTTGSVDGPGVFDVLMRGFKAHLDVEFEAGRITGDDYTKAYIALTQSAMSQGAAFLLQKDQSFWQAQMIQVQAFTARVDLEIAKVRMAESQYAAAAQKSQYALVKMQIANADNEYCISKFNLEQTLPTQQAGQLTANSTATYNLANILPKQAENLTYQGNMLKEQTEAQRAQTLDIRSDGAAVVGVLGKQKALYTQQITSYQRDAELKAARIWSDAWITQKTIDEGLVPPTTLTNTTVNSVLESIRINNNL